MKRKFRKLALSVALVLSFASLLPFPAAAATPAPSGNIARAELGNGLRVIVVRNTLAAVVSTSVNYLVGAGDTPAGFPGMAHALEHMMFRGSPGLSADQLANIGSIMGGDFNANTQQTVTQYLYTVPAEDLDIALHIEALRMQGIDIGAEDWAKERGAIEQEVAQDVSDPGYILFTRLRRILFKGTSYAYDGLGTRASFDKTTAATLKQFYERWYAPNNAILVLVGDLDPSATLEKVQQLFGAIPRKTLPNRKPISLTPVKPQALQLKSNLPYGMQVIALRMPGFDSPDFAACEVLAGVLSSQRGALHELVPQGKALSTDFSFSPLPKAGFGYAIATFPAGGNGKALQREVRAVLRKIARDGVAPDLVAAAKLRERRAAAALTNSIEGLASAWAEATAVYGLDSPDQDLERIEKVSVEDVNRVARKYLDLEHAVEAVLIPRGSGKAVAGNGVRGKESIALGEAKPVPLPEWAQPLLRRLSAPQSTINPSVTRLANGLTLIVQQETLSKTVSVFGHIRTRPELAVPKGKEGVSMLLDQLFSYGSERLDRVAFQRALDSLGAQEEAGADFSLSVLQEHFSQGVELLADNELHPALPEAAFATIREQVAQSVAGSLNSPGYRFQRALQSAIFPSGDPTLREALPATVSALSIDDVRSYYRSAFRPDLTAIVVVGNVTAEEARRVIEKYFGNWKTQGPTPESDLPAVPENTPATLSVADPSRSQARVTLAETIGINRSSPDYYALQLGNTVLGGGFYSARLSRNLRKNAGLVYSIDSSVEAGKSRAIFSVQYACDPGNVAKVHASVAGELQRMREAPVTAEELQRAKAMMVRQIPLSEASIDAIALQLISRWDMDLPFDESARAARRFIELGAEEVRGAFSRWVRPADLVQVTQGPTPR